MAWTQEEINEIYVKVQHKSAIDEEFREELLKNPNEAIEKLAGEKLPEGFRIKVIENDPAYAATFVLPDMVSGELSENELDEVAGGACVIDFGGCGAQACAAKASASASAGK